MAVNEQVAMFYDTAYEHLLEEMNQKDDLAIKLGDTLDMKASILLAAITLLATQTVYFFDRGASGLPHYLLIGAAALLSLATISAFVELWPRTYMMPVPESSGIDRAAELRDFYSQCEDVDHRAMLAEFTKNRMGWAQSRITANQRINRIKSKFLEWSFYLAATAMLLNIATLFMRLF